jgi:hypothetical protein
MEAEKIISLNAVSPGFNNNRRGGTPERSRKVIYKSLERPGRADTE